MDNQLGKSLRRFLCPKIIFSCVPLKIKGLFCSFAVGAPIFFTPISATAQTQDGDELVCCRSFYGDRIEFSKRSECLQGGGDIAADKSCRPRQQSESDQSAKSEGKGLIFWKPDKTPFDAVNSYNDKSHTYNISYTQNRQYSGTVDACDLEEVATGKYEMRWRLSKKVRTAIIGPAATWETVWRSKYHSNCKLLLGNEISLAEWVETGEASTFDPSGSKMPAVGPLLPGEGEYRVTVTVMSGGYAMNERSVSVSFNINDILIALIGDSYASGEGNPDTYGEVEPTLSIGDFNADDIWGTRCEPTTLLKLLDDDLNPRSPGRINSDYDPANEKSDSKRYFVDMDRDPEWLDISAHRSSRSGHAKAVNDISRWLSERHGWFVTFVNFAVSGATTENLIGQPQHFYHYKLFGLEPGTYCNACGQIQELKRSIGNRKIDYLIISVGGNDVGFQDAIEQATIGDVNNFDFAETLANLEVRYQNLQDKIEEHLDVGEVILSGYPVDLFSGPDGSQQKSCGLFRVDSVDGAFLTVDEEEIRRLAEWGEQLRSKQQALTKQHGWTFVDVSRDFETHGYCQAIRSYFRSAEGSCIIQGDMQGVMHPNEAGHEVYRKRIGEAIRKLLIDRFHQLDGRDWRFEHEL
ncbi:MAG: GDSL-type esterase/lipase family protein [Pseudomonadota bacterium]